ncbi:transcription factor bHLH103-like isoform X2 [Juglans microcarpa x Juglans regia]|uniref:transcription factor bHLH103-like isoform X2 n=1 Tax=Juglans microcarpa x Juglans regia TaxID=2249226 RepID=UPI001B7DD7F9|nr:transcription factor bHLH103-like isoform X2 [Juglans microcarpa x Juglans regia]
MRNALLHEYSSHLYSFGNSTYEVQMPNLDDVSMQMNSEGDLDGNGFLMKPVVSNNEDLQLGNGSSYPDPFRSLLNYSYQSGYESGSSSCADIIPQHESMLLSKRPFVPQFGEDLQGMPNVRKRPIGLINDSLPKIGTDMVGNMAVLSEWKKNKRNKVPVPMRRSGQKLSDKITALQKLVSPYGKTDTASVLQEASLYIKLLHQQIQNLSQMLSSSYKSGTTGAGHERQVEIGEQLDLRSNGLCLVPVSVTQNGQLDLLRTRPGLMHG